MSFSNILKSKSLLLVLLSTVLTCQFAFAYITHNVTKGESLWGIANKYNVSVDDIIKANPGVETGLKAGVKIKIPETNKDNKNGSKESSKKSQSKVDTNKKSNASGTEVSNHETAKPEKTQRNAQSVEPYKKPDAITDVTSTPNYYIAQFGDTFRSIASKTGVSVADLLHYNPFIADDVIAEGTLIRLSNAPLKSIADQNITFIDSIIYGIIPDGVIFNDNNEISTIVIALPFNSASTQLTRQNHLATDFYKGFLLAANKVNNLKNIRIVAVDTKDGVENTINQIKDLNLGNNSVIIPTEDELILSALAKYGAENNIIVLNTLNIRDNKYTDNKYMIQCNINQPLMYNKAISYLTDELSDYTPVILSPSEGASEKTGFVDALKNRYNELNREVITLSFSKQLTDKDLDKIKPGNKYVFIPKSGSADVFEKFSPALQKLFEKSAFDEYRLFGYPDWVTFTGENKQALHNLNAIIYSRFFLDDKDLFVKETIDEFDKWYGAPMINAFPTQGMLGYDTANLIFKTLNKQWIDNNIDRFEMSSYNGEQSSFHLIHDNGSKGLINVALYIVEFVPGETFYVITI